VPGDCTCGCTLPPVGDQKLACADADYVLEYSTESACGSPQATPPLPFDLCADLFPSQEIMSAALMPQAPAPNAGLCQQGESMQDDPSFAEPLTACVSDVGFGGSEPFCASALPTGYEDRLCVYQLAVTGCPEGYEDKIAHATTIEGEQGCMCVCDGSQLRCDVDIELHGSLACDDDPPLTLPAAQVCETVDPALAYNRARLRFAGIQNDCLDLSEGLLGTLVAEEDATVCCQPAPSR
jgi:hypothetical protein